MRMMSRVTVDVVKGNEAISSGNMGKVIGTFMERAKPEPGEAELEFAYPAEARRLIALRRSSEALARGGVRYAFVDDEVIAYLRETRSERLLCLASRSEHEPLRVPLAALGCRELEPLYGAEAETDAGDAILPAAGPSFHVWRLSNG